MTRDDISTLLLTGKECLAIHAPDKARTAFEAVLALDPHHPEAHYHLGRLHHAAREVDLAEQHYRAALEGPTPFAAAYLDLGALYETQGSPETAATLYQRCIAADVSPKRIARARASLARQAGRPFKVCVDCGRFTTLEGFRSYGSGEDAVCPRCYSEANLEKARSQPWLILIGLILFNLLLLALARWSSPLYPAVNSILVVLLLYAMIPLHELAHAGVAWLLGGRVFEIRLGVGKPVWEKTWRGLKFSLRRYPVGGACILSFPTLHRVSLRTFLAVAAGPGLSGLLLVLFLSSYDGSRWLHSPAVGEAMVWVNLIVLVSNLWPRRVNLGPVVTQTDGSRLIKILTGQIPKDMNHLNHYLLEGFYALQRKDFARTAQACREGQALYPDNPYLGNMLAVATLELGDFPTAAAIFERQLEELDSKREGEAIGVTDQTRDVVRALLLNNLAITMMIQSIDSSACPSVLDYAEQAYSIFPWHHAVEGTWGAALVECGRPELGLAYLEAAHSAEEPARERASTLAYIAWAHSLLGREAESEEALQQALALDAQHYMVRRAQTMMAKTAIVPPS